MEAMEEDRIEFLKSNVWEYANIASTRLLIEDEVKKIKAFFLFLLLTNLFLLLVV